MNHRIVSAVVTVIVALFVLAGVLFAASLAAITPHNAVVASAPNDPHPTTRRTEDCRSCHRADEGTVPVTHRTYSNASCPVCHEKAVPVLVPHSIAMGDVRCPLCHSDPTHDHGIPADHLRYETDECLLCHPVDADDYMREPPAAGLSAIEANAIPHPVDAYFADCTDCHRAAARGSLPASHRMFAIETCLDCHQVAESVKPVEQQ